MTPEERDFVKAFPFEKYTVVSVVGQGMFYIDDENDCVKKVLKSGRPWEGAAEGIMRRYVKPNTNVLDIGAHIGTHTITLANIVGEKGLVLAFEPQQKIYRELVMNLKLNKKNNVLAHHLAIGKEQKTVFLGTPIPHNEGARFISSSDKFEQVEMRTLDSFELSNISFVKIDVENFELDVLKGAVTTFSKEKPVILIEIQGNHVQAAQISNDKIAHMAAMRKEVLNFLETMGYRVSHVTCDDYLALPK